MDYMNILVIPKKPLCSILIYSVNDRKITPRRCQLGMLVTYVDTVATQHN
jgi:hypothetical protein